MREPPNVIDVWLLGEADSYTDTVLRLLGLRPSTPYGFFMPSHQALFMNISTGGGTLAGAVSGIVRGDEAAMSPEVALGVRFARAVLARDAAADAVREEIARRWGPRAVLALALRVMGAQLYPTLKYALGHGKACTRVVVAGQPVSPQARQRVAAAAGAA